MESLIDVLGYSLAGVMGLILGLLGGGGSILTVPVLVYCFGVPAALATGYSLLIVGVTSGLAAIRYIPEKLLDFRVATLFAIPSILGVLLSRMWILPMVPEQVPVLGNIVSKDQLILFVFSLLIIFISFFMFKSKDAEKLEACASDGHAVSYPLIVVEGLVVGTVTGFVGAGGGFMIVPALVLFANIPLRRAIATSLLIISSKSLIGFGGDLIEGLHFDWGFLTVFLGITLLGTMIGTKLNSKIHPEKLRQAFAYFVFVMGVFILIKEGLL